MGSAHAFFQKYADIVRVTNSKAGGGIRTRPTSLEDWDASR